jgi:hypothetical protein
MAEAGDKGILLGDYIKFHAPEPYVRGQLDRGELPYTWTDIDNNARASDDGGPVPPKGWWPRPEFTTIDRETSEVRGHPQFPPHFPPMFRVRVFPPVAPKAKARGRPSIKSDLVAEILADIDQEEDEGLGPNLLPAEIEKKVLPHFRKRWAERKPADKTDPPVSRKVIFATYQNYLKGRPSK